MSKKRILDVFLRNRTRILLGVPVLAIGYGIVQGIQIRLDFLSKKPLGAPDAPISGTSADERLPSAKELTKVKLLIQTWLDKVAKEKDEVIDKVTDKSKEVLTDIGKLKERERARVLDIAKAFDTQKEDIIKRLRRLLNRDKSVEDISRQDADLKRSNSGKDGDLKRSKVLEKISQLIAMTKTVNEYTANRREEIPEQSDDENDLLVRRIGEVMDQNAPSLTSTTLENAKRKRLKLLIIGDSLAAGVGCEAADGPVLPALIAQELNLHLNCDVEWHNSALVGGTIVELRDSLRKIKEIGFLSQSSSGKVPTLPGNNDSELIVLVICGLNDWKTFFFSLYRGFYNSGGPYHFKAQLLSLINELKQDYGATKVFLPGLPMHFLASDPNFVFGNFPFSWLCWFVNTLWDTQKFNIAAEDFAFRNITGGHVAESMNTELEASAGESRDNGIDTVQSEVMRIQRLEKSQRTVYASDLDSDKTSYCGTDATFQTDTGTYFISEPKVDIDIKSSDSLDTSIVAKDGVHLSKEGYQQWAYFLAREMLKKL
jgi:hypothetical protein